MSLHHQKAAKKAWASRKKMIAARAAVAQLSQPTDSKAVETAVKVDLTNSTDHKNALSSSD
jgi:hypothetical protein